MQRSSLHESLERSKGLTPDFEKTDRQTSTDTSPNFTRDESLRKPDAGPEQHAGSRACKLSYQLTDPLRRVALHEVPGFRDAFDPHVGHPLGEIFQR